VENVQQRFIIINLGYILLDEVLMNDELGGMWKEAGVVFEHGTGTDCE
jgi:hypothetical protein